MRNVYLIAQRELRGFFLGFSGYLILAAYLLASGLLFNLFAVGDREKFSRQVLEDYFYHTSGLVMIMAVLLAMRLIAEERQTQSFVLLRTSPVSEREIVLGKFLSAVAVLAIGLAASAYLPALILVSGKISFFPWRWATSGCCWGRLPSPSPCWRRSGSAPSSWRGRWAG